MSYYALSRFPVIIPGFGRLNIPDYLGSFELPGYTSNIRRAQVADV